MDPYLFMRLKSVSAVGDSGIEALTENTRKGRASIEETEIPLVLSYSRTAALQLWQDTKQHCGWPLLLEQFDF